MLLTKKKKRKRKKRKWGISIRLLTQKQTNIPFRKKEQNLWTGYYPNIAKAEIAYLLMDKNWIRSALNYETHSSFEEVSSDYRIVTAKIRLGLRRNNIQTVKTTRYNWYLHTNSDISKNTKQSRYSSGNNLKHIFRITSTMPSWKQLQNAYQANQELSGELHENH